MLLNEGYEVNGKIEEAIYILQDGTLFDGGFEEGCGRCVEHREMEAFSKYDRYDGDKFWNDVMENIIMLIPESKEILIQPNYTPTTKQNEQIERLLKLGFEINEFK
jgi:hypothetical protein